MLNVLKKILSWTSVLLAVMSLINEPIVIMAENRNERMVTESDWEESDSYPLGRESSIWLELSITEKREVCEMPEEMLSEISTEDLVEYFIDYPENNACIYTHDNIGDAFEQLNIISNVFREYTRRDDSISVLIDRYDTLCIDTDMINNTNLDDRYYLSGYNQYEFIQKYLAWRKEELDWNQITDILNIIHRLDNSLINANCEDLISNSFVTSINNIVSQGDFIFADPIGVINSNPTGFTPLGPITPVLIEGYYVNYHAGYYYKYNTSAFAYRFYSADIPEGKKQQYLLEMNLYGDLFTLLGNPTAMYNCHSYVWINQSLNNIFWLDNPTNYANHSVYAGTNCSASIGRKILIYNYQNELKHSAVVTSSGSNKDNIQVVSKFGPGGLYSSSLGAAMDYYYGYSYKVYC